MDNLSSRPAPRTQTRGRILQGLDDAICELGLDGVTVAAVLRHANVSRRTYYQYFGSLQVALVALHEQLAASLAMAVLRSIGRQPDLVAQVRGGASAYLDFQVAGGPALYALQRQAAVAGSPLNNAHEAVLGQLIESLVTETERMTGVAPDPLVFRGLLLGIEAVVLHKQRDGTFSTADRDHVAGVLEPVLLGLLRSASSWARPVG